MKNLAKELAKQDSLITEQLRKLYPEEYAYCSECENYIHEDNQVWINEEAHCPNCNCNLEK